MATLPELPRGVTPYVVDLTISRQEFERRIMLEADEIGAAFDAEGRLVVRPRRGDAYGVDFLQAERPFLIDAIVVHNHPLGGIPSSADGLFAIERSLAEMRVVVPSGLVYSILRPDAGWPSSDAVVSAMEQSIYAFREETARRSRQGLPPFKQNESREFQLRERQNDLRSIGVWLKKGSVWEA